MRVQGINQSNANLATSGRRGIMRKLESIMHRCTFLGPSKANLPFSLENLEGRQMLAANVAVTPGQYLNFDIGAAEDDAYQNTDGVLILGAGTSGITGIEVQDITDGGGGTDTAILNIRVTGASAGAVTIQLASNLQIGSIDLSALNVGTTSVTLVIGSGITTVAANADEQFATVDGIAVNATMQAAGSVTMSTAMAQNYVGVATSGIVGTVAPAGGYAAVGTGVTFGATVFTSPVAVQISVATGATGVLGTVTANQANVNLVGQTSIVAGKSDQITFAGALAPGATNVAISATDNAGTGIAGLSFGSVSVTAAGKVDITSQGIGAGGFFVGAGGVTLSGAGGFNFNADANNDGDGFAGPLTLAGTVAISSTGSFSFTGGSGAGAGFGGAVSIGAATLTNSGDFTVTTQNNGAYTSTVNLGTITTDKNGGSYTVNANGTGQLGTKLDVGAITIGGNDAGNNVNIGNAGNNVAGPVNFGNITNTNDAAGGDVNVYLNNIAGLTTGNIDLTNAAANNDGSILFTIADKINGAVNIAAAGGQTVLIGETVSFNQNDTGKFNLTVAGDVLGLTTVGPVTLGSTNDGADLLINYTKNGSSGGLALSTITANGAGNQKGDFSFTTAGAITSLNVGAISLNAGTVAPSTNDDTAGSSGVTITSGAFGTTAATFAAITNRGDAAVYIGLNNVTSLTVGNIDITNDAADIAATGGINIAAGGTLGSVSIANGGTIAIGEITNSGKQSDQGAFNLTATGQQIGNTTIGNIVFGSTNDNGDFTIAYNDATSTGGQVTIGTVTATGNGDQEGDFSLTTAGTFTGPIGVNTLSLNVGDTNGNTGFTLTAKDLGVSTVTFQAITNAGNANVDVNLNTDAATNAPITSLTIGSVSLNNVGNINNGNVLFTVDTINGALLIANALQAISIGDQNESDAGDFGVTVGSAANAGSAGTGITTGPVLLNSTNGGDVVISVLNSAAAGPIVIPSITADGTGDQAGDFSLTSAGSFTTVNVGNIALNKGDAAGTSGVTISAQDTSGAVVFADILNAGNADVIVDLNADSKVDVSIPSVTIGNVSTSNVGNTTTGNITFAVDSITGALNVATGLNQTIVIGDPTPATDSGNFSVAVQTDSVTTTLNGNIGGGINLGPITIGGGAAAGVTISTTAVPTPNSTGGNFNNVTLQTLLINGAGSLHITGVALGAVTAAGEWNLQTSTGSSTIASAVGNIASIGPAIGKSWDINFINQASGSLNFNAADNIGPVTISSVDFEDGEFGAINFSSNTDFATEATLVSQVGSIGAFLIQNQGDNSWTNAGVPTAFTLPTALNDTAYRGTINALTGSTINIAGSARDATFNADLNILLANTGGSGKWDAITFNGTGNTSNLVGSDKVTINAQDGITSITAAGANSTLNNLTVDANTDAATEVGAVEAALGTLGALNVVGNSDLTFDSPTGWTNSLSGTINAAGFSTVLVQNGSLNLHINTNVNNTAGATNRNLVTSQITSVIAANGSITGGSYVIDDGFTGGISATQPTPTLGDITLGNLDLDADGNLVGATRSGGLPGGISASGSIDIFTLDSFAGMGFGVQEVGLRTTASSAANNIGAITAGESILIGTIDVGGNIGAADGTGQGIVLTEAIGAAATQTITLFTVRIAGSIDRIANKGDTAGDTIFIVNASFINGDIDTIAAGRVAAAAAATFSAWAGLTVVGGTTSSPIYTISSGNVDYFLVVDGTFTSGVIDSTVVFSGGNELTINDIEGTTSNLPGAVGTRLLVLTRVSGTSYTAADDVATLFNVTGIQDDIGGGNTGQHDFLQILIEGNVLGGNWGADSNNFDGSNINEPTLGSIKGIEMVGNWNNNTTKIFATSADELAYGSLTADRFAATAGVNEYSYDNPSGVFGDGVLPPGGGSNGTVEDLNTYTLLTSSNDKGVILSIPDGGSLIKTFVGPNGVIQTIRFTDTQAADGVVNTVVIDFNAGVIDNMYLYGRNIGIEYQATTTANAATNSTTDIFYGTPYTNADLSVIAATNPAQYGLLAGDTGAPNANFGNAGAFNLSNQAIAFIESSSSIGNVTVLDIDAAATPLVIEATDQRSVNVGNIRVGYNVVLNGLSDLVTLSDYINDNNSGFGASGSVVPLSALGVPVYGSVGSVYVDGTLGVNFNLAGTFLPGGGMATSGGVASVDTNDTVNETLTIPRGIPTGTAPFGGLVTDLTAGAIHIDGSVLGSLVVGDRVVLATGANLAYDAPATVGVNADTFGINTVGGTLTGTSYFTSPTSIIIIGGNLGLNVGSVTATATPPTITVTGDEVSAPYGINQIISISLLSNLITTDFNAIGGIDGATAGLTSGTQGQLRAAIISGKHVIVDIIPTTQAADDIDGSITAVDIFGDIWSGDDLTAPITATGATSFLAVGQPPLTGENHGVIGSFTAPLGTSATANATLNITATGAGVVGDGGDITGDIVSDGTSNNVAIVAGSAIVGTNGTGFGGSILANIIFGADGTGGLTGTNSLIADNNIGSGDAFVVSSADSQTWTTVSTGRQNDQDAFGGDLNSDFVAGVPIGDLVPVGAVGSSFGNFNDSNLPIFQNQVDSITVTTLDIGFATDGVDQDVAAGNAAGGGNDLDSNLTGTFAASAAITFTTFNVDGNATGNDGFYGGHVAAAGLGNRANATFGGGANTLTISGGTISGILDGTLSSGMFVSRDQAGGNPLNANDLGPEQAGTVLTLGGVAISGLTVGRWEQSSTGTNGLFADGINLSELLAGTENGSNSAYAPSFSIGATDTIAAFITVVGRPFIAPQTGPGSGGGTGSGLTPNGTDGDAVDVSIAAFQGITGVITARDQGDINFVMSDIDAITAINTTNAAPGDPSDFSTTAPRNSGQAGNLGLAITTFADGGSGLDVEYYLAGFDYFTRIVGATTTSNFFASFGLGAITAAGTLFALDSDATDGFGAGNLTFALVAAGEGIAGSLLAQGDITARTGSATTDGTALVTGGFDADVLAGANVNNSIAPLALNPAFSGGNLSGSIIAGDDIASADADTLISIAAQGNSDIFFVGRPATGNISGNIVSGAADQLDGSAGNLNAFIVAGGNLSGNVDAGDTQRTNFGTIVVPISDLAGGAFRGGIWVGAGADLDINTVVDNSVSTVLVPTVSGTLSGNVRTVDGLDVTNVGAAQMGILVENAITGVIEVGYGAAGGDLLGNIVAEANIAQIEVFGDLGSPAQPGLVYAGGLITLLIVGNPQGATALPPGTTMYTHPLAQYTSTFGNIYSDIYEGGAAGAATILVGGTIDPNATLLLGVNTGLTGAFTLEQAGFRSVLTPAAGTSMIIVQNGPVDPGTADAPGYGPDVYLYITPVSGATTVGLTVTGNGQSAGLGRVVAVDSIGTITVTDGSIRQVIADDDFDIHSVLIDNAANTAALEQLAVPLSAFPFLVNSLPTVVPIENAVNNQLGGANLGTITSDFNIGTTGVGGSIIDSNPITGVTTNNLNGLTQAANVAIWVQGSLTTGGTISSATGSIGNIVVGGGVSTTTTVPSITNYTFTAFGSVSDVYAGVGSIGTATTVTVTAATGSAGVFSAEDNIGTGLTFNVRDNIKGLIARTGTLSTSTIDIHGHFGILQASGAITANITTETGSIGFDLDAGDIFVPATTDANFARQAGGPVSYGIYSDIGSIAATLTAGGSIGNTGASLSSVAGTYVAGDSIGLISAGTGITTSATAQRGSIGNLLSVNGDVTPALLRAGTSIGNLTALVGAVTPNGAVTAGSNIGNVTAATNIGTATYTAERGNIGNFLAQSGNIGTPVLIAGGSIGTLTALLGTLTATATAVQNIGNLTAAGNLNGTYLTEIGSIGNLLSQTGGIGTAATTVTAGDSVGTITATIGTIGAAATTVTAVNNIGNITAGAGFTAVLATFTAQQGNIGNILARTGDVNGTFTAGGNVGSVTASLRDILGTTLVAAGLATGATGTSIGDITAGRTIQGASNAANTVADFSKGFYAIRGSIGTVRALTGNIGTSAAIPAIFTANGGVELDPNTLQYVAAPANGRKGVGTVFSDLGNIFVNITTGGDVGTDLDATNAVRGGIAAPLGTVDAGLRIGGNFGGASGAQAGSVTLHGPITTGELGSSAVILGSTGFVRNPNDTGVPQVVHGVNVNNPLIITSTLTTTNELVDYRVLVSSGTAEVIYTVDITGRVTFNSITYVSGGVDATLQILTTTGGRTASGIFGQSSVVAEVVDIAVNGSLASITVEGNLGEAVVNGSVGTITVEGTLNATLTVSGDVTTITVGTDSGDLIGDVHIGGILGTITSTGDIYNIEVGGNVTTITSGGTIFNVEVGGNLTNVTAGGNLENLEVGGNLAGGTLDVGSLGDATITGNIGTSAAVRQIIRVATGSFGSLVSVDGTNFGLQTVIIDGASNTSDPQVFSFTNTLNNLPGAANTADDTVNVYIGKGTATLIVNNGYIQSVLLRGANASNLVVLAASGELSAAELKNQAVLIKAGLSGKRINGVDIANSVGSATARASANIGMISTLNSKFSLKGAIVEGNLGSLAIPGVTTGVTITGDLDTAVIGGKLTGISVFGDAETIDVIGGATNVTIGEDLGSLDVRGVASNVTIGDDVDRVFTSKGINNLKVVGNAGLIDGGLSIKGAVIQGPLGVEILKATNNVSRVQVVRNVGILSSGNVMSEVFVGGSSITVGARSMVNVQISGSVGASVQYSSTATAVTASVALGSAFGVGTLNTAGLTAALSYLILGSATANFGQLGLIGNKGAINAVGAVIPGTNTSIPVVTLTVPGAVNSPDNIVFPAETLFYGGLQARYARNVVVGGAISDTVIYTNSSGSDSLFVNTIDDARVRVGKKVFTKVDGVITSPIAIQL